jgi:Leucine-rich repeat (LRR) protein
MPRLRELNLARNDILTVGDALADNTALEVLNLADNAIGSFKVGTGRRNTLTCCLWY